MVVYGETVQRAYGHRIFHDPVMDLLYRQIGVGHQVPFAPEVPGQCVGSLLEVLKGQQPALFIRQQNLEFRFREHILAGDLESVHLHLQGIRQIQFGTFCLFYGNLTGGGGSPLGFCPGPVPCFVLEHGGITLPLPNILQRRGVFPGGGRTGHCHRQYSQAQCDGCPDHWMERMFYHSGFPLSVLLFVL